MAYRVGMISLGCPKNQVDAEIMMAALERENFEIVDYFNGADAVIINTCGFIDDAKKEAIDNILSAVELKKEGIVKKVIVTGCLAQRYQSEILDEIPEVDAILGIGTNAEIPILVRKVIDGEQLLSFPPNCSLPLNGKRVLTTPEYWAYLKIADGCSNRCTYCTIPSIRGDFRSREMQDILDEAQQLALSGVKELIVIAQDTTSYGIDLYGELKLPELLNALCEIDGIEWIRLLYCYPDRVTDELLEVMSSQPKVVHYIDLPLQHIDDKILTAMNRRGSSEEIKTLIEKMREKIPDIVIRTTFITGFPGEGEEEFETLAEFINKTEFDRLGCFVFSPQEGTPANDMPDQIEDSVKTRRSEVIMQDQYEIVSVKNNERIGKTFRVLVEEYDGYTDSYVGRTYMDAPEIDGLVKFTCSRELNEGDFVDVKIFSQLDYDLLGEVIE
ncbi:MAG: 30S ribosomal protein S12 methylthiotransferase RimO [Clostridiales bacterium]|jgi:ribosomal protein S12 methylthiotransferase|nr:30S ribosomal protein S12 methylthiotransferase RimO [Clostridiales bacterium]